jgi:hypothetical protein
MKLGLRGCGHATPHARVDTATLSTIVHSCPTLVEVDVREQPLVVPPPQLRASSPAAVHQRDSDAAAITELQLVLATRPTLKISF